MKDEKIIFKEKKYTESMSGLCGEIKNLTSKALEAMSLNGGGFPAPIPKNTEKVVNSKD
jgi:hypothetical protein